MTTVDKLFVGLLIYGIVSLVFAEYLRRKGYFNV